MSAIRMDVQAALARSDRRAARDLLASHNLGATASLILASGGDLRIWPDPVSGRNRYGTKTAPAPDEIGFSSTTASNISPEGFAAALEALPRLLGLEGGQAVSPDRWFDEIRGDIVRHLGVPGSEAVLAASGTDAELLTLGLVAALATRPITNIFIAPDETGNGVPLAAAGRHFSDATALGGTVAAGQTIEGLDPERIDVRSVAIRDDAGKPREAAAIDRDVALIVEQELRRGRDVLLHVLDASKTGLAGVTRETARSLAAAAPGRVRIVIDACQMRSPVAQLRRDLSDGFIVAVTGSKFVAGPPFAGALLLPGALTDEIRRSAFPAGLASYTAALDWPAVLRDRLGIAFTSEANIGLGLRWIAALDNIAAYAAIPDARQTMLIEHFAKIARTRAKDVSSLLLHPDDAETYFPSQSIVSATVLTGGSPAPMSEAQRVQLALRDAGGGPICHVGQAVSVGARNVLRISASARDIANIAARMDAGQLIDKAFEPVAADLDALFAKWSAVTRASEAA